jgi:L-alanine-DL-glutamate epimerase-like enolase superfamily enzyme
VVTHADVVVVTLYDGQNRGRGEARPTPRYGETIDTVIAQANEFARAICRGITWESLYDEVPAGAARNAVDCAAWDLQAKRMGLPVWQLIGILNPAPAPTACTISLDSPDAMAAAARESGAHSILKLKLGTPQDVERVRAVRAVAPGKRLIVDVNEAWSIEQLRAYLPALVEVGIEMVEQPLPAGKDDALKMLPRLIPLCADESCHTSADLKRVSQLYEVINIKLDKTGGLTEALRLARRARSLGLEAMVGCMPGTSLAIAPATLLMQFCRFVDLDAPLMLRDDREFSLDFADGLIRPPTSALWG